MNAISIEELAASDLQHDTDYQKQKVCLTGELEYCEYTSDFTRDYDCLMLIDPDSFTGIKCRTTSFDRSLIGVAVKVNVWYLQTFEEPLLNVSIIDATVEETDEPLSTFIENARMHRVEECIESNSVFRKLSTIDDREPSVNLVCIVAVKSPMFLDQERKPYFIIQITQDDISAFIRFRGKDIRQHYSEIEIDNYYVFENIELPASSSDSQFMLFFDGSTSDQCKLNFKEAASMLDKASSFDPPASSSAFLAPYDSLRDRTTMGGYTGIVTTVIDPILGLYILDKKWFLALTQCPSYNPLASYLEGSKLTVKRAHLASFHTNAFGSIFLNQFCHCNPVTTSQEDTWLTLVACTHTSITLDATPTSALSHDHAAVMSSTPVMEAFIANSGFAYQHGYLDMVVWMEAYLSLLRKTRDISHQSLIEITNALLEKAGQPLDKPKLRDLYQEFIQHTTHCLLCTYESHTDDVHPPRLHLPNYPSISQLADQRSSIPNLIEVPIASSVHNDNPLTNITIQAYTYSLSHTKPFPCILLGYIAGGVDGRLYFADAASRIPIVLTNKEPHHLIPNCLYIITHCTIVEEDLGYMDPNGDPVDCSSRYMLAKWKDVIPLQSKTRTITFCTSIPNNMSQNRLFACDAIPGLSTILQNDCHVIRIEHVQSPYLTFDDYGKLYLACYVDVTMFDLVSSTEASTQRLQESPMSCKISLSSTSKTLALLPYMQVGCWYVLQNGSQATALAPNVIELVPSASIYPILPSRGQVKLEQYVSHNHFISSKGSTRVDETNILSVKDILNINFAVESEPDSPAILSNGFYKKLVSFEGYVVIKEFTESRIKTSGLDRYTQRIYQHLGVGTGKPNRWLYMRIRCVDSPDTVDIYYDVSKTLYPHGLIPGYKVQVCKVSLKVSDRTKSVYGVVVPRTCVQVVETEVDTKLKGAANIEQEVENRPLIAFLRTTDTKIYKTVCTVRSIQQVNISWICLECGQRIIKDMCFGTCSKEKRLFLADAVFTVTDGTADITVSAHGEDMVMTLLRLSPSEVTKLKEAAWMQGELSYSNWFTKADISHQATVSPVRTLQSICTSTKIFESLCLYVKRIIRQKNTSGTTDSLLGKLNVLPIKLNSDGVQSLTFTRVRLEALKLEVISSISEATALL